MMKTCLAPIILIVVTELLFLIKQALNRVLVTLPMQYKQLHAKKSQKKDY